jgi:hypothetical protein
LSGVRCCKVSETEYFKVCSTCRKPIGFGADYFRCSVSTCNRARLALYFCTLTCWDAHLPEAKHRDAWAERVVAPTLAALQHEQQQAREREPQARVQENVVSEEGEKRRRVVSAKAEPAPEDVLVVVSKLKAYVKARSSMNTSDGVVDLLSDRIRRLCDAAIEVAQADGRKTVLDRDFE